MCRIWHSCRKQRDVWSTTVRHMKLIRKPSAVLSMWHDLSPLFGRRISSSLLKSTLQLQCLVCCYFLTVDVSTVSLFMSLLPDSVGYAIYVFRLSICCVCLSSRHIFLPWYLLNTCSCGRVVSTLSPRPPYAVEHDVLIGRGSRLSPGASAYQRISSNNSFAHDEQGVHPGQVRGFDGVLYKLWPLLMPWLAASRCQPRWRESRSRQIWLSFLARRWRNVSQVARR